MKPTKEQFQLEIVEGERTEVMNFPSAQALLDFVFIAGERGVLRDEEGQHIGWRDSAVFSCHHPAELVAPEAHLIPLCDGRPITPEELRQLAGPRPESKKEPKL